LTLAEAALLAGLPQRPTAFEPFEHLKAATERRNTVLAKMQEIKVAKPDEVKKALKEKIKLAAKPDPDKTEFKAPHFTNYVLRQLISRYGKERVYNGGLQVYTTLNYEMQKQAESALLNGVMSGKSSGVTEGALVSVEPRTGYIRAMVGGVNFQKDKFNYAAQGRGRQPGSSFKVFVYTAAFMSGRYGPESTVLDAPVSFGKWSPKNYGGKYHGYVTIRSALTHSYNIPAVKVANEVGIKNVIVAARKMGVKSPIPTNLAVSLGAAELTPLEVASAYSTYPNRGSHAEPMGVIYVKDTEGSFLENNQPQVSVQAIPESVAANVSSMLADVVQRGTAASAKGIKEVENAHGKTGTTNDNRDAWFVGYTPELSTAVWVCGQKIVKKGNVFVKRYPVMEGVTGGRICAPMWARFMKAAVPIQRRAAEANRKAPEEVVPHSAKIKAEVLSGRRRRGGDQEELEIPRAEATPDSDEDRPRRRRRRGTSTSRTSTKVTPSTPEGTPQNSEPAKPEAAPVEETPKPEPAPAPAPEPAGGGTGNGSTNGAETGAATSNLSAALSSVCADSGKRATRWCPETVGRRLSPSGRCRLHKPHKGDG
jgi:membrane peptidoglycan carboxypeptidase